MTRWFSFLWTAPLAFSVPPGAWAQQPSGAPSPAPPPDGLVAVGAARRIDTRAKTAPCNETTVSVSAAEPRHLVAAWNDYRQGAPRIGVGLSFDGGETWSDAVLRPPLPYQSATEADPMTASDPRTGTLWVGGMSFGPNGGVFVARKQPGHSAVDPPVMAYSGGGVDKGMMAAGPAPGDPQQTHLYVAFNLGVIASGDLGQTWSEPVALEPGLGYVPRVGPSGNLYVAYWDTLDQVKLVRSLDGGATLEPSRTIAQRLDVWGLDDTRTPGRFRVPAFPTLAVDAEAETLYCAYADSTQQAGGNYDVDIYFTRSEDLGETWSTPVVLPTPRGPLGDQFFPWLDVDERGRVHIVYYDTGFLPQNDDARNGWLDAVYTFSRDRGLTWSEARLTDASFSSEHDGFGGIFIGDYLGLATAGGRTVPVYMSTASGSADIFGQGVTHGAATAYCLGFACPCGNIDPKAGCGNAGLDGDPATGARLVPSGSNFVASDDLSLALRGLRPFAFGLLLSSRSPTAPPFGDGRRCVGGQVYRFPVRRANAAGVLEYGPHEIVELSAMFGPQAIVEPASTWNYQGWYRDSQGPCGTGFNLTNGLSVTWR